MTDDDRAKRNTIGVDGLRTLNGQVAVITGAAGVIGQAITRLFVEAGAQVVLGDRRYSELNVLASELGERAEAFECDVSDPKQVEQLVELARERWSRIDVLINGAGLIHFDDILRVSLETWRNVFAVNVEAALVASQHAAEIMATQDLLTETNRRGTMVHISSQGAEFPSPDSVAYGASKTALNYLSRNLASALEHRAISSTVIYPGMVYGGIWQQIVSKRAAAQGKSLEELAEIHLAESPTGQFQEPLDLAKIVLYVACNRGMTLSGRIVWSEAHQEWS